MSPTSGADRARAGGTARASTACRRIGSRNGATRARRSRCPPGVADVDRRRNSRSPPLRRSPRAMAQGPMPIRPRSGFTADGWPVATDGTARVADALLRIGRRRARRGARQRQRGPSCSPRSASRRGGSTATTPWSGGSIEGMSALSSLPRSDAALGVYATAAERTGDRDRAAGERHARRRAAALPVSRAPTTRASPPMIASRETAASRRPCAVRRRRAAISRLSAVSARRRVARRRS